MLGGTTKPAAPVSDGGKLPTGRLQIRVHADAAEVRRRLDGALLGIGSLWFSTLAELRRWDRSTEPLFIRWRSEHELELGPRVVNVQAARFCPVLHARLVPEGNGTLLEGVVRMPRFALGLLGLWAVLLVGWFALEMPRTLAGAEGWGWLFWWAVLAGSLLAAGGLGWRLGGAALAEGLLALEGIVADPEAGEDDWA